MILSIWHGVVPCFLATFELQVVLNPKKVHPTELYPWQMGGPAPKMHVEGLGFRVEGLGQFSRHARFMCCEEQSPCLMKEQPNLPCMHP